MTKAKVRGTSTAPMVLGLIGGILGLPAAVCSGACAAGLTSVVNEASAQSTGNFYLTLGIIGAIIAIVFSCLTKKAPILSGIMLLVATFLSGITLVTFNFLTLIVVILILIAGILCLTQKKETVE